MSQAPRPLIGLPCCTSHDDDQPSHWAAEKYITAVSDAANALPFLIPAISDRIELAEFVDRLDGLLLTGSRSNVEPRHYGGAVPPADEPRDPARDALTLPLIRAALAADLPALAICRGIQELNVALGGTLHSRVHEVEGRLDHRGRDLPVAARYAHDAHSMRLAPDGFLARLAGTAEIMVNSLHWQGIDRLAPDLRIEAVAPDGQIEAVRHATAGFVIGVQWHPEYCVLDHEFSRTLFAAFGDACRRYRDARPTRSSNATSASRSAASRSPMI